MKDDALVVHERRGGISLLLDWLSTGALFPTQDILWVV